MNHQPTTTTERMNAKPAGPVAFDMVTRRIAELVEPYREICDLTESEFPVDDEDAHGEFIADAFNVHHETGLTPREILAEMSRMAGILEDIGYPHRHDFTGLDDFAERVQAIWALEQIQKLKNASTKA